jgi:tRNA G18 (ribose-2'-O)-methylase SpoU
VGTNTLRKKRKQARIDAQRRFIRDKNRNLLAVAGPFQVVIVLDGLKPNFNIGKIFRSGDAFGIRKIHLVNTAFFDPAPAKGSFRWVPAVFDENFAACHKTLVDEGYHFFVFTPHSGKALHDVQLPERSAFVFGHEEFGFSFELNDYPNLHPVYIPQIGKVECLNVSVAASIAMYDYARQHPLQNTETTGLRLSSCS